MLEDRRKFLRFDIPLHVKFKPSKGLIEKYVLGVTTNFSRQGFCFEAQNIDLEPTETLELKVMLPRENAFVPVLGDIVWKKRVGSKFLVGIQIIEMHKEAKWEILDYAYTIWLDKAQDKNTIEKITCSQWGTS